MAIIHIDGKAHEVQAGDNLLETCLSLGLDLPYFCWHPAMGSIGACRQCAVIQYQNEEDTRGRLVMACMTPVTDGALFSLDGDKAKTFRQAVVESLMLNHPHDCPVCAEGGECHLQDMTAMAGHRDRHYRGKKITHHNQYLGPLIHHEMNRCISCYRCTRYYNDYAGGQDLAALASHDHVYFGRHQEGVLESEFAGNLVEVCPTGVFTDKQLVNDYTRKWDLQSAPSVCSGCAVGCNTMPGERYGRLKRVHNRYNAEVNGYFLCDRGRFGASWVNHKNRLNQPGLRSTEGRYDPIDPRQAISLMAEACRGGKVAGIGSPRASVEANFLLRQLVGANNYTPGFSTSEQALINRTLQLQQETAALVADIRTIESADAVLIIGEDVTDTAPRIALALRQAVRNKSYQMAAELQLQPWQDAAIRNLAQEELSPLYILSTGDTKLDDVAQQQVSLAPNDIARLGFAIAAMLADTTVPDLPAELAERATQIATTLGKAQRPLIVSGTGCNSVAVLDAAAAVANALCVNGSAMLSLAVPEFNSLGQALLCQGDKLSLADVSKQVHSAEVDTLIVLENDLYRRGNRQDIDALLEGVSQLIVLDSLDNSTLSACSLAVPAASFTESEGTVVSMEGRAQRYYPVSPTHAERHGSWQWLLACMRELEHPQAVGLSLFDDVTRACAAQVPALVGIIGAAPDHHYRNAGVKIPRQPHRYSGRTAMRADISVHEPKQSVDLDSPLAYTMEGLNRDQPAALLPFVWSPGWNSNQSLHKFQSEVGGAIRGGSAGARLLSGQAKQVISASTAAPVFEPRDNQWQLVSRYRIFGSEELSVHSPGIGELVEDGYLEVNRDAALQLGIQDGDGLNVNDGHTLEVRVNDSMASGCVGYTVGHTGCENLAASDFVSLQRAPDWQRKRPDIIGSDSGGKHG